jgi:hypothetical protein
MPSFSSSGAPTSRPVPSCCCRAVGPAEPARRRTTGPENTVAGDAGHVGAPTVLRNSRSRSTLGRTGTHACAAWLHRCRCSRVQDVRTARVTVPLSRRVSVLSGGHIGEIRSTRLHRPEPVRPTYDRWSGPVGRVGGGVQQQNCVGHEPRHTPSGATIQVCPTAAAQPNRRRFGRCDLRHQPNSSFLLSGRARSATSSRRF